MSHSIEGQIFQPHILHSLEDLCLNPDEQSGRIVLVIGQPGTGKSVLLSLLYARLKEKIKYLTAIRAELLDESLSPEKIQSIFEKAQSIEKAKVLLLDSLDVLAAGRMEALQHWLSCLDRLRSLPYVTAICACRRFEAEHLYPLNVQDWSRTFTIDLPDVDWVKDVIHSVTGKHASFSPGILEFLRVPLHSKLAVQILKRGHSITQIDTLQSLYKQLFDILDVNTEQFDELVKLATIMVSERIVEISLASLEKPGSDSINQLALKGLVLVEGNKVRIFHQTLADFVLAWDIVYRKKPLVQFLLERNQSLFIRPVIRHVLSWLRSEPSRLFKELEPIFFYKPLDNPYQPANTKTRIRVHVKLAALANMASWTNATPKEASFLLRIFTKAIDGASLMAQFFAKAPKSDWFHVLEKPFLHGALQEPEHNVKRRLALAYIANCAKDLPSETMAVAFGLIERQVDKELTFFFTTLLEGLWRAPLDYEQKVRFADLVDSVIRKGFIDWEYEIVVSCKRISKIDPKKALSLYFHSLRMDKFKENIQRLDSTLLSEFHDVLSEIYERIPFSVVLELTNLFEDTLSGTYETSSRALLDFPEDLLYGKHAYRYGLYALYAWYKQHTLRYCHDSPDEADNLIKQLETSKWRTQRELAGLAMLENPSIYSGQIAKRINEILNAVSSGQDPAYGSHLLSYLIKIGLPALSPVEQQKIMARIVGQSFDDDLSVRVWIWKPLHHIPEIIRTPAVRAKLLELDFKIIGDPAEPPIRTTDVRSPSSPVTQDDLRGMGPDGLVEFLLAHKDLKEEWTLDKWIGGVEYLAQDAAKVMVEDLHKYRSVIERLAIDPKNDPYTLKVFAELWQKDVPPLALDWIIQLINTVWRRPNLQLEITRMMAKLNEMMSTEQFRQIKPVLIGLSTEASDPVKDHFYESREKGYSNTALGDGINFTRGALCESLVRAVAHFQDLDLLEPLEILATDRTISVRAALVYYLPFGLKAAGWDNCLRIFIKACEKGLDEYADVAGRFLQYVPSDRFHSIQTLMEKFEESKTGPMCETGLSLMAIYHLRDLVSEDHLISLLADPERDNSAKEEGLRILANSVKYPEHLDKVLAVFNHFLVSKASFASRVVNILFMEARPVDFPKMRLTMEATINISTIEGDVLYYLLEYLEKCLLVDARGTFAVLERLLARRGDDFYEGEGYIRANYSKAPLNIINTIFECELDLEEQALNALDRLIELRWSGIDEYFRGIEGL